ncbi:MAG: aminopeptidase P family protein [Alphaproteobacteria bacterium]|nr:aminopeptidase P family protein [Alphaproteobacteria bacterium]
MTHKNKINNFINLLKEQSLDAFIVPHNDEFMNEQLPPHADRLSWLTGFTGSAGSALIFASDKTKNIMFETKNIMFVDSRYTLQASKQLGAELFDIICVDDMPINKWIAEKLTQSLKFGYYPWFHTIKEISKLKEACEASNSTLHACSKNPIDIIWEDKPKPLTNPIFPAPLSFAGISHAEKISRIQPLLKKQSIDAAIVTSPDSISWLLNIRGNDVPYTPIVLAFAIVHASKSVELVIDMNKITPEIIEHFGNSVHIIPMKNFSDTLVALAGSKIRIDEYSCPEWILQELLSNEVCHSGECECISIVKNIQFSADVCEMPKAIKNEAELKGMESCHIKDGVAVVKFLCWFDEQIANNNPITEIDAENALYEFRKQGSGVDGNSFPTIASSGSNGAIVHYHATKETNKKITYEDLLFLCDSGGQYKNEGTTDITRTFPTVFEASDMPDEVKKKFTLVLKSHIALSSHTFKSGTTGEELDEVARKPMLDHGLDYGHGTGHGVGCYLNVHEGPQRISRKGSDVPFEAGMIISVEPGYYKENAYGIRIENLVQTVWMDTNKNLLGFKPLTLAPIDRRLIDISLLSQEEIDWIDTYHNVVKQELYISLDTKEQEWLNKNTKKLK